MRRLSDDVRRRCRELLAAGDRSMRQVARELGISHWSVRNIAAEADGSGAPPPVFRATRRFDPRDPAYRAPTIAKLRSGPMTLTELTAFLGVDDAAQAGEMVESLRAAGHNVEGSEGAYRIVGTLMPETAPLILDTRRLRSREIKVGIIADTHLGSQQARLDVCEMAYDAFAREKVAFAVLAGNALDGYREYINGGDVLFRNAADQMAYFADHYPHRRGIATKFITGLCHEGWWIKATGLDIGHALEDTCRRHGREDIEFIGHIERDLVFAGDGGGEVVMRVFHPGGGTAYAQSYKPQKIVESYQGGEKPHILVIGHFHKLGCFYPRGVWTVLAGCAQDQTRWMRSRHISAHVGFGILRFRQDATGGISSFAFDQYPFYDKGYHLDAGEWTMAVGSAIGA